jgi:hypothetical protein
MRAGRRLSNPFYEVQDAACLIPVHQVDSLGKIDNLLLLLALSRGSLTLGSVLHLGIAGLGGELLLVLLLGLLKILSGLLHSLELGALLGSGLLLGLADGSALLLLLLLVALDDGAGNEPDFIHLGDVDGLGGVLALLVQPVLEKNR